jgi:glycosyltransferase involved in cell wall biosynthesis
MRPPAAPTPAAEAAPVALTARVGVNGLFLSRTQTGTGQYCRHLLQAYQRLGVASRIVVLHGHFPGLAGVGAPAGESHWRKLWIEQVGCLWAARRAGVRLLHYPYLAAPLAAPLPVVVTAHDAIPFLFPAYRQGVRVRAYVALVALALRRAALVLTDSTAAARDLRRLGLPADRLRVVPLGVEERFQPGAPADQVRGVAERYGLAPGRFLLYLGGFDPRKNIAGLVEAYARARARGLTYPLVLAGALTPGPLTTDPRPLARRLGVAGWVRCLGPVAEAEKPLLYQAAAAFVWPSLYEGFGLPPLEAVACGVPVVCSDRSSHPEVVGPAALLVDPTDPEALAEALCRIVADDALRAHLRGVGPAWARQFTWERTARETLEAYRAVLGETACGL